VFQGKAFADLLGNPEVGLSDILKQLGEIRADWRVLVEQQPLKHGLMDRDHLPEMRSAEIHETLAPDSW